MRNFTCYRSDRFTLVPRIRGLLCLVSVVAIPIALAQPNVTPNAPCLSDYRDWVLGGRDPDRFEWAATTFSKKQCDAAARAHEQMVLADIEAEKAGISAGEVAESRRLERERAQEARSRAQENRLQREHTARLNELRAATAKRLAKPGVRIGMSPDQVLNDTSWGKPERISRRTTAAGTTEQWIYGPGTYLYFEGGRLVTIDN